MRNKKIKTDVLKRRFKIKTKTQPEIIDPSGDFKSRYAHLCACKYYDSDRFAFYEANFPDTARAFFSQAGADKYNHDCLDLEIEKNVDDEHRFIDYQYEVHLMTLEDLHTGVEVEKESVNAQLQQVQFLLNQLRAEHNEIKEYYESYNRKVG